MCIRLYNRLNIPDTHDVALIIVWIFRLFPTYNLGEGLIAITTGVSYKLILGKNIDVFSWNYAGRNMLFMALEAIVYFLLVLSTEFSVFRDMFRSMKKKLLNCSSYLGFNKPSSYSFSDTQPLLDPQHSSSNINRATAAGDIATNTVTNNNTNKTASSNKNENKNGNDIDEDVVKEDKKVQNIIRIYKMETESNTIWDERPTVTLSSSRGVTAAVGRGSGSSGGSNRHHNKPKSTIYPSPSRVDKRVSQSMTMVDGHQVVGVPSSDQDEHKSTSSHSSTSSVPPVHAHLSTSRQYDGNNNTSSHVPPPSPSSSILDDYTLILNRLGKIYSPSFFSYFGCGTQKLKRAVDDLSLVLKPGERFGLLGMFIS